MDSPFSRWIAERVASQRYSTGNSSSRTPFETDAAFFIVYFENGLNATERELSRFLSPSAGRETYLIPAVAVN